MFPDPGFCGRDEFFDRADEFVHQAQVQGLGRGILLALQQDLHGGVGDAQHAYGTGDAATAGQQAQGDFGQSELDAFQIRHDAVVGAQSDFQAAAERRAVDCGDHRPAEGFQAAQLGFDLGAEIENLLRLAGLGGGKRGEVATGEEGLFRRGQDHPGNCFPFGEQPVDCGPHRLGVGLVHDVGRLRRVVHGEDYDAVVVLLPADHVLCGGILLSHHR